jgi:hypothetical protein
MLVPPPDADVAQRQLQDARGAHDGVADGVLVWPMHHTMVPGGSRHLRHLGLWPRDAAGLFDLVGRPLGQHLLA